jgi:arginase
MAGSGAAPVELLCVPYDSARRGYRMGAGPQALLRAGLVQSLRRGGREVELVPIEGANTTDPTSSAFDLAARIAGVVHAAHAAGRMPVVVAGNCIATVGALAGLGEAQPGVLWLDAHADINTPETSTSGFLDGMAAATCLGWCHSERTAQVPGFRPLPEARLILAGARDIDAPERAAIEQTGLRHISTAELRTDPRAALAAALDGITDLYIHLDLDVLDAQSVGPANSFAVADGLTAQQLAAVIEAAGSCAHIAGLTVSAYDPEVDTSGAVAAAALLAIGTALRSE